MLGKEWAPCDGPGNGRAKVSKGLQKRVAVVIAEQKQPSKPCGAPSIQSPGLESPAI
jgi:hypothetical protein